MSSDLNSKSASNSGSHTAHRGQVRRTRLTRRQLNRRWFWLVAGSSFMAGLMMGCGKPQDSSVPVRIAPQTESEKALSECARRSLSAQFKTLEGEARPVCRRGADGQLSDRMLRPRYQAQHAEGRISIRQAVALRQVVATGQTAITAEQQGEVVRFMNNVCRPAITSVFRRSGVRVEFGFRMFRADIDQLDSPAVVEVAGATERVRGTRVQSIVDFEVTDTGLRLADEPEAIASGSLTQTDFNVHQGFCAQLALRLSENLGFTSGRDCASRAQPQGAAQGKTAAVFKATSAQEFFAQAKLQPQDLEELYRPICQGSPATSPAVGPTPQASPQASPPPSPEPTPQASPEPVAVIEEPRALASPTPSASPTAQPRAEPRPVEPVQAPDAE